MAPQLRSNVGIAARHGCSVCGMRKVLDDFPMSSDRTAAVHVTVTCTECLKNSEMPVTAVIDVDEYEARAHQAEWNTEFLDEISGQDVDPEEPRMEDEQTAEPPKKRKRRSDRYSVSTRKRRKTAPTPKSRECRICAEEKPSEEFPKGGRSKATMEIPQSCVSHLGFRSKLGPVCKDCIGSSLTSSLELVGAERIGCLEPSCTSPLWEYSFIQRYLSKDAFEIFSEQLFQLRYVLGPNFFYCPNKECNSGALATTQTAGYPNVICASCKQRNCALCRVPWHEGLTCQEYRFKNDGAPIEEDKEALKELVQQGARRCPRCQMAAIKDGGCDHMTCTHCYRSFSWTAAEEIRLGSKRAWKTTTNLKPNGPPQVQQPFTSYYAETCEQDRLDQIAAAQAANPSSTGATTGTGNGTNLNPENRTLTIPEIMAMPIIDWPVNLNRNPGQLPGRPDGVARLRHFFNDMNEQVDNFHARAMQLIRMARDAREGA